MKSLRTSAVLVIVAITAVLALSVASVSAAPAQATVTVTEAQINSSFRVTNPPSRRVTNLAVDLQPGQAVTSFTLTLRSTRGQTTSYAIVSTWTPSISNGRITWALTNATANGAPASQTLLNQINAAISSSWRAYWRNQHPGRATAVTVDANQVVITYS